jgi:SseB protein N-terminal domain/SseB protein C-terminal domain
MPFISENELEKALVKAVQNPASAPDFYRLLLESDLLVLGSVEGREDASEKFTLAPGGKLSLVPGVKNGGQFLPVFSSLARMQEYVKQESKFLSINGRALLDLTRGAPVTLNPASEYGKELTPGQVQQLLDGAVPRGEARTIIGEADYPAALVEALVAVFASRPDIETAWMIQVTFADRAKEPHPLVGIETGSDWPSLMQAIKAAAEKSVPGMVFDVQRVDRRNPVGMTSALLQAAPFYQRRAAGPILN